MQPVKLERSMHLLVLAMPTVLAASTIANVAPLLAQKEILSDDHVCTCIGVCCSLEDESSAAPANAMDARYLNVHERARQARRCLRYFVFI